MLVRRSLLLYVWMSLLAVSLSEVAEQVLAENPCTSKKICSDCMQTPSCAWCFAQDYNGPRCFNPSIEGGTAGCDESYVFNPDNQQSIDPMYNRELTRAKGQMGTGMESSYYEESMSSSNSSSSSSSSSNSSSGVKGGAYGAAEGENVLQIRPQRVTLQLRMKQMLKMSFSYAQAQNLLPVGDDLDNMLNIIREQYNKIITSVEMKDTSSDALQISYYSSCLGSKDTVVQTNKCDGLKVNDVVEFTAAITLKECPKDPRKWKQSFAIYPVPSGAFDSINVEVEMRCDCPCEHPGHHAYDGRPEVCNGHGISECGVCVCKPGYFGNYCECYTDGEVPLEPESGCRPTNATSGPLCSDRGTCVCGACACNIMEDRLQVISGQFCECDNFSCDMNKGRLCSGPDHGECVCGKCSCRPGFTGPACN
ncbi:integrin beta-PS-like [Maniola jurtina]|uniref:integrin beta-PS-like n=1 Tax=Maniola jurtina TaxID=191418 RepID=UPI001E687FB8|nr:integrin beta-PS-like [Maniola jurtina]